MTQATDNNPIPQPASGVAPGAQAEPNERVSQSPSSKDQANRTDEAEGAVEDAAVLMPTPVTGAPAVALSFTDKVEAFIARLSTKNTFWHRVASLFWLPYAFKSGIRMKRVDTSTFAAVLPFKRFNRNWYNAMAGAALLANSEIAAGMYIIGITGGDYTIVCKHLEYKFLRPCFGPAVYHINPREDIRTLIATGKEFNITLDVEVYQQAILPEAVAKLKKKDPLLARMASKERRVGRCVATFHVTPTLHQKAKRGDTRRVGRG